MPDERLQCVACGDMAAAAHAGDHKDCFFRSSRVGCFLCKETSGHKNNQRTKEGYELRQDTPWGLWTIKFLEHTISQHNDPLKSSQGVLLPPTPPQKNFPKTLFKYMRIVVVN